ncbi:hypothetical protein ACFY04_39300 [Streptomyces sp. NPDC001549]|uniref:hypothetical protein n=1 Tax=Streptomyces sp. NPDC001549 TaxID=3364586 RepID=UPI0036833D91
MSRAVIIAGAVVALAAAFFAALGRGRGGRSPRRRFGPEYDRPVTRHKGDTMAAGRELGARMKQHGAVKEQPLPAGAREQYAAQWAGIQQRFVDSPQESVTEADALLARLAKDRGFPGGGPFEEQLAALSVHHASHVDGYRRMHRAVDGQESTEEMRRAMIEGRGLFDALVAEHPDDSRRHPPGRHHAKGSGPR